VTKKAKQDAPDDCPHDADGVAADDAAAERSAVDDIMADDLTADFAGDAEPIEEVDPLEAAQADLQQAVDRELRCRAELENYRKRVGRERADERRYANLSLMRELLPVLDNLDRAIAAAEQSHDASALLEGVKMVSCQLIGVLAKHDCVPIEALNESFDPHRHEAILHQPSEDVPADMVTYVTQTGYRLHDRVVRPTQVIVSSGPPETDAD
jgi:molecular chaperone GrpE